MSAIDAAGSFSLDIEAVEGEHAGMKQEREYRIEIPQSFVSIRQVTALGAEIPLLSPVEEPRSTPYWQSLPDHVVVELDRRSGPLRLEFS